MLNYWNSKTSSTISSLDSKTQKQKLLSIAYYFLITRNENRGKNWWQVKLAFRWIKVSRNTRSPKVFKFKSQIILFFHQFASCILQLWCCGLANYTDWQGTPWGQGHPDKLPYSCCQFTREAVCSAYKETAAVHPTVSPMTISRWKSYAFLKTSQILTYLRTFRAVTDWWSISS